jgi:hypothetical protein
MSYARFLAAAAIFTLAPLAQAQEATTLKYMWHKGDSLRYHYTIHSTVKISDTPIGALNMKFDHDCTLRLKVGEVADDGSATIEASYESIHTESDQGIGGASVFDSKNPEAKPGSSPSPAAGSLKAIIDQPFMVVLDARGGVLRVDAKDFEAKMADAGGKPGAPSGGQAAKNAFGEGATRRLFRRAFEHLPATPVKQGDTWTVESELAVATVGEFNTTATLTLAAVEKIGADSTARITGELKDLKPDGNKGGMKTDGSTGHEEIGFNATAGRLNHVASEVTSPMEMTAPAAGAKASKVDMHSTFSLDRLEGQAEAPKEKAAEPKAADPKPKAADPKPGEKK